MTLVLVWSGCLSKIGQCFTVGCSDTSFCLDAKGTKSHPDSYTAFAPQKPVAIRLYLLGGLYCTARLAARCLMLISPFLCQDRQVQSN